MEELTDNQEKFLLNLMASSTIKEASSKTGISHDTAQRWLKLPHVQEKYTAMRKEVLNESLLSLAKDVSVARETLRKHCTDENTSAYVQVLSAKTILENGLDLFKLFELEQKIVQFEEILKGMGKL